MHSLSHPSILLKGRRSTEAFSQVDSRESPLNQIRITSTFRTVSAFDVKQILGHAVDSVIVSWSGLFSACYMSKFFATHQHALSETSDPLHLSSQTGILLPSFFLFHADSLICMLLHRVRHWIQSWDSRLEIKT